MLHITVCGYITIIIVNPYCPQWGMGPHQYPFFLYRVLSFAIVCASPQDKPITLSSVSTVFLQVVLGLTLPLFSCRCPTKGILSGDIHKTFLDLEIDTYAASLLVQVVVGNFVGPEDVADRSL